MKQVPHRSMAIALALATWIVGIAFGQAYLLRYEFEPGAQTGAPHSLPATSSAAKYRLLVFLHPRCPCSRATLSELHEVLVLNRNIETEICFYRPAAGDASWDETELWQQARAIPDVKITTDTDGVRAGRFGCATSGHALLYAPDGQLAFSGGLTSSRGMVGENAGCAALRAIAAGKQPASSSTPVYGCSLVTKICDRCRKPRPSPTQN